MVGRRHLVRDRRVCDTLRRHQARNSTGRDGVQRDPDVSHQATRARGGTGVVDRIAVVRFPGQRRMVAALLAARYTHDITQMVCPGAGSASAASRHRRYGM